MKKTKNMKKYTLRFNLDVPMQKAAYEKLRCMHDGYGMSYCMCMIQLLLASKPVQLFTVDDIEEATASVALVRGAKKIVPTNKETVETHNENYTDNTSSEETMPQDVQDTLLGLFSDEG